jgi:plastocyanin
MRSFVRALACATFLVLPTLLLTGCGGAGRDTDPTTPATNPPPAVAPTTADPPQPIQRAEEAAEPNQVVIDNFRFGPRVLTVAAGTRVTWVNRDDVPHTATSSGKPRAFDSGTLDTDGRFSFVFTTPGTYDYFCAVHPHMTGRVVVK